MQGAEKYDTKVVSKQQSKKFFCLAGTYFFRNAINFTQEGLFGHF